MRKTFPKNERLTNKIIIQDLFSRGASITHYPLKTIFLPNTFDPTSHKVLIAVSRKKFKNAVDRNRLKRQIREAYRLNKHILADYVSKKEPFLLAFIYIAKEKLSFQTIESKMIASLKEINNLEK